MARMRWWTTARASGGVDVSAYGFTAGDSEDSDGKGMDVEAELQLLRREVSDATVTGGVAAAVHGVAGGGDTGGIEAPVVCYGQACIYRGIDTRSSVVRAQVLAAF
ncbi:hypothetical protein CYMTET_56138 [Cymbomonas tetramitiformis]|uniref:Uncharacterized protein n=1 Tax=Cymbomonas tetramitiformis TaxID=36881 RepID=A0AAE0BBX0_9CHLO|nr:hypothetical protein CYMTET_56138 [Cymbomonas tetramitiformis]